MQTRIAVSLALTASLAFFAPQSPGGQEPGKQKPKPELPQLEEPTPPARGTQQNPKSRRAECREATPRCNRPGSDGR
jgi:hypothetical protein